MHMLVLRIGKKEGKKAIAGLVDRTEKKERNSKVKNDENRLAACED